MRNSRCLLNLVSWHFLSSENCFFLRCLVSCFSFQTECHQWCSSGEDRTNTENKKCNFSHIWGDGRFATRLRIYFWFSSFRYLLSCTKYQILIYSWPKFKEQIWKVDMKKRFRNSASKRSNPIDFPTLKRIELQLSFPFVLLLNITAVVGTKVWRRWSWTCLRFSTSVAADCKFWLQILIEKFWLQILIANSSQALNVYQIQSMHDYRVA